MRSTPTSTTATFTLDCDCSSCPSRTIWDHAHTVTERQNKGRLAWEVRANMNIEDGVVVVAALPCGAIRP
jgi:positive regulator of sigma E activity